MKNRTFFLTAGLLLAVSMLLGACGASGSSKASSVSAGGEASSSMAASSETSSMDTSSEPSSEASSEMSSESMSAPTDELRVFTAEELAQYNGKDGQPAYVAVEGVVYDVTNVPQWANGEHNGNEAGKDLTDEIENDSPHGTSVLDGLPVVGTLVS